MSGVSFARQLSFGKMDLELHLSTLDWLEHSNAELDEFIQKAQQGYVPRYSHPHTNNVASFGHLFSGPVAYASGYYSYKWAEVLDADAFSRFQKRVCSTQQPVVLSVRTSCPKETLSHLRACSRRSWAENPIPQHC